MAPGRERLTNCWLYARALYKRLKRKGRRVYRVSRWSDWGPFKHYLVAQLLPSGRARLISYKPCDPRKRVIPPPLFKGRVAWGDFKQKDPD